ncbi:MAG TPA: uroporphyrinogen decarboxylase family protein [Bryobacteraceae bacterium]|nr:uroporphyrinogen decarboxylase family protein [Bryobacteraceae bacterium]
MTRRQVLLSFPALALGAKLNHKQRVDRALQGLEVDRPPFSFWYHFGLEKYPGERHARATLDFHRKFGTDLVKVMSDYPFPRRAQPWYALRPEENPFPEQIRALEMIREGLAGSAYFIETIFNPWNVAEKLSSREEVLRLKSEKPQALLDALEGIARSEASHARRAVAAGAAGIFLAIANADASVLTEAEYARFSEPFDKMILEAVKDAPLNTLHLHGSKVYLHRFYRGWPATVFHYSMHATGVPIAEVRRHYPGVIMGGLDETNFRKLTETQLREQWRAAAQAAGPRFILAPGCSVPNDTTDEELMRLVRLLG